MKDQYKTKKQLIEELEVLRNQFVGPKETEANRKRVEEKLRKASLYARNLIEASLDPLVTISSDGKIMDVNQATEQVTGITRNRLIGSDFSDYFTEPVKAREGYQRVLSEGLVRDYPLSIRHTSGRITDVLYNATIYRDEAGEVQGLFAAARDITERNRAEDKLREEKDRAQKYLDVAGVMLLVLDPDQTVSLMNRKGCEILGYQEEEIIGKNWFDHFIPERDRSSVKAVFAKLVAAEIEPVEYFENSVLTKSGMEKIIAWHNTIITDEKGHVMGTLSSGEDVTERKRAEEALRESEERYRTLVETSPDAITLLDLNLTIISANRPALNLFGYENAEEVKGKSGLDYLVLEERGRAIEDMRKMLETGSIGPIDYTLTKKDGTLFPAELKASLVVDSQKKPGGIILVSRDITERKQADEALRESEERYRTVIEHSNDGVAIDRGSQPLFVNQRFVEIFGYDKPEEILGKPLSLIVHPDDIRRLEEIILRRQRGEVVPSRYEFRGLRKNGETIDVEASATQTNYRGESVSLVYLRDITDRKRAEEALRRTEEQLRQSQKMEAIGQLAGGVAHDFNNLLTVIKGYSQLSLNEIREGEPLRGNIEEIRKATDRAADLTRQLLAFSRRQIMEMRVLDLNDLLVSLEKMLRRVIGEDIELVTLLAEDLGRVKTDPGQIEQVIMNLAVNARDAMLDGGKLTIETANVDLDEAYARSHIAVIPGRYVMISVSDTGVGMATEVRGRVFEPFFTTKEKGKGTGLGLSTVYGIVKQSGGNIWVYSEPGKGTTFKIYLPRVDEAPEELKEKVIVGELPRGSETILVVEDEEDVRKLAMRILERQGYKVLEASEGLGAFLIVEEYGDPIHLLVTDVVMPKISGRELADRMAEIRPEIKVLYMSGYTDNAITHHGILEKGKNYLQKPFTMEGLARKVREVLDK